MAFISAVQPEALFVNEEFVRIQVPLLSEENVKKIGGFVKGLQEEAARGDVTLFGSGEDTGGDVFV
jgi:hypothetical protein